MMKTNTIGIIGMGKMGSRMAERLFEKGYHVVSNDLNLKVMGDIKKKGIIAVESLHELAGNLSTPRIIILSVPAGKAIDDIIGHLSPYLSYGDIIIDSSNSFYKDSQRRSESLKEKGIYFLDAGVSGGIHGARNGACIMIGGDKNAFEKAKDVFEALSKNGSCKYLGKSGAGHLVKGYHNLAEYGYLQALAEVLSCLGTVSIREDMNISIKDVCEIWNKGSILESRVVRDAEVALDGNPSLEDISGSVFGQTQKEMEKLVKMAEEVNVDVPACKAALRARIDSHNNPTFAGKIINAIRNVFGGHKEWAK